MKKKTTIKIKNPNSNGSSTMKIRIDNTNGTRKAVIKRKKKKYKKVSLKDLA